MPLLQDGNSLEDSKTQRKKIMKKILAIDDIKENLVAIKETIEDLMPDYLVLTAQSGKEGLKIARDEHPDTILLDIVMPEMDGYEVCKKLKEDELTRHIPIIVLTAIRIDTESKIQGLEVGADAFLSKPIDTEELIAQINVMLRIKKAEDELRAERELLDEKVKERTKELKESQEKLQKTLNDIVIALTSTLEIRDPYTAGHQKRVSALSCAIAQELELSKDKIECVRIAALLHDIGKIYIPSEILSKPGAISPLEYEMIRTHPAGGYNILKDIDFPWPIAKVVKQHHERLDGSGYPDGLKGDEILLEARIIAVADVVEAMNSPRPYRSTLGILRALKEIEDNSGVFYDAEAVQACIKLFKWKKFDYCIDR